MVFSALGTDISSGDAFVHDMVVASALEASDWFLFAFVTDTFLLQMTSLFSIAWFVLSGSVKVIITCPTVWLGLQCFGPPTFLWSL